MDGRAILANVPTLMIYVVQSGLQVGDPSSITCTVLGNAAWPFRQRTFIRNDTEPPEQLIDRAVQQIRRWKFARSLEHQTLMDYRYGESQSELAHRRTKDLASNLRSALMHLGQSHADETVRVAALCAWNDAIHWD